MSESPLLPFVSHSRINSSESNTFFAPKRHSFQAKDPHRRNESRFLSQLEIEQQKAEKLSGNINAGKFNRHYRVRPNDIEWLTP